MSNKIETVVKNIDDDKGNGVVLSDLLNSVAGYDENVKDRLESIFLNAMPDLHSKSSFIQRAVVNRILINRLILGKGRGNLDIVLLCSLNSPDDFWVVNMSKTVIPKLIKDEEI